MYTTHRTEIRHALGQAEAMARLKSYTGWARGYSDLKGTWEGNRFSFTTTIQGASFRGTIQVEEDRLELECELPANAPMFGSWLPRLVQMALVPRGADFGTQEGPAAPAEVEDTTPAVLYLHIPKAAGHTLTDYIRRQCAVGEQREGGGTFDAGILTLQYGFFKDADLKVPAYARPFLRRPDLRAVTGHFTYGLHEHVTRPWTYVTVLRDPVDRVLSLYYFVKLQERMSLEEFAADPPFREIDNDQVRRIAGVDPALGACTRADLEKAKDNLRRHFAVMGTVERFEETLVLLNRRLGWDRQVPSVARNVNPDRKSSASLPESTLDAIRGWNELDVELYRFVQEWMDRAIEEEGPAFHEEMELRRGLTAVV
ncbi:MAG TPA: polyhydroxyalkanoic acid system family protein [Longimicrobiaceae bacterium]|nr:polyhydroxyalkanoic acid system family protein [Longimicrobiaceae bacterium]